MDLKTATDLDEELRNLVEHANNALYIANNSGDEQLRQKAQEALGSAIAIIDIDLWERIYSEHPSLRPPEMIPVSTDDPSGSP